jgi:hypothetical protein
MEHRIDKRRDWAGKATANAAREHNLSHSLVANIPFGQPILVGHYSEKAHRRTLDRSWNALGRAVAATDKAEMHESKADNLGAFLDKAIFSDDGDALEALKARIAEKEAKRAHMKTVNTLYRKADVAGLAALGMNYEALKAKLAGLGGYFGQAPYMPYSLTNLGASIRTDKERLATIAVRQTRAAEAEASPNGVTLTKSGAPVYGEQYVRVTFAEKPEREILTALKAAGFHWSNGCWAGKESALPASVKELI